MPYEIIDREQAYQRSVEPLARVNDRSVAFNSVTSRKFTEANITHILFLWDKEGRKLAFRPTESSDTRAFPIRVFKTKSCMISTSHAMRKIGWNKLSPIRCRVVFNDSNGLIELVELGATVSALKGRKKRRRPLDK